MQDVYTGRDQGREMVVQGWQKMCQEIGKGIARYSNDTISTAQEYLLDQDNNPKLLL